MSRLIARLLWAPFAALIVLVAAALLVAIVIADLSVRAWEGAKAMPWTDFTEKHPFVAEVLLAVVLALVVVIFAGAMTQPDWSERGRKVQSEAVHAAP